MIALKSEVYMLQRLFQQDQPDINIPEFKTPGQAWLEVANKLDGNSKSWGEITRSL